MLYASRGHDVNRLPSAQLRHLKGFNNASSLTCFIITIFTRNVFRIFTFSEITATRPISNTPHTRVARAARFGELFYIYCRGPVLFLKKNREVSDWPGVLNTPKLPSESRLLCNNIFTFSIFVGGRNLALQRNLVRLFVEQKKNFTFCPFVLRSRDVEVGRTQSKGKKKKIKIYRQRIYSSRPVVYVILRIVYGYQYNIIM